MSIVTIKLRYQRHSARKLRPFTRLFSGKNLLRSIDQSSVMSQDSAKILNRAFKMAKAAATEKHLEPEKLVISEVFATEGPHVKRIRANARGRTNRYLKHLAHVTVAVTEAEVKAEKKPAAKAKEKN